MRQYLVNLVAEEIDGDRENDRPCRGTDQHINNDLFFWAPKTHRQDCATDGCQEKRSEDSDSCKTKSLPDGYKLPVVDRELLALGIEPVQDLDAHPFAEISKRDNAGHHAGDGDENSGDNM